MSFDWQPVLKGELIELRPLRPEDHDDLYAVAADPLIWEQHPVKNRCEPEGFRVFFDEAMASGGALIAIDARTQRAVEKIGGVFAGSRFGAGGRESYVYQITAAAFEQQAAGR